MKTINKWIDELPNGKRVEMGQDKNGMHYAEIRDSHGEVEAGTLCKTANEVHQWIENHCDLLRPIFEEVNK
jgi:hypothetical protein